MQFTQTITLAAVAMLGLCGCAFASYGAAVPYSAAIYAPENAEAAASAITDIAAAKASAAKIDNLNFASLNAYGHQIGVPLLVKPYGGLTGLYSALAPKRSFVGTIDSGFYKDGYGKIKFRDETAVGAIAI